MRNLWPILLLTVLFACSEKESPAPVENLAATPSTVKMEYKASWADISVVAKSDWTLSVDDAAPWLSADITSGGEGTTEVKLSATQYTGTTARTATVIVTSSAPKPAKISVTQAAFEGVTTSPTSLSAGTGETTHTLSVIADGIPWEASMSNGEDWCELEKQNSSQLKVTIKANTGIARTARINIKAASITTSVKVSQEGRPAGSSYANGEVICLQTSLTGTGPNLVLMGDGYTAAEMKVTTGKYEKDMRAAADHFFSVYPYSQYRKAFNIWMVCAVSQQSGMGNSATETYPNTIFSSVWTGGTTTNISCNSETVRTYAKRATTDLARTTVIMPINQYVYAGTCMMWPDGFAIAMCPVGGSFRGIVMHEGGGHGFAKLIDEYRYYDEYIPAATKTTLQSYVRYGFYSNCSFQSEISLSPWSDFAGKAKYPMVGMYEGAYMYSYGIWRPEENSCMNNNVAYYNAPSRWTIIKRIKTLSGQSGYTLTQFMAEDNPSATAAARTLSPEQLSVPLGRPVVFDSPSQ